MEVGTEELEYLSGEDLAQLSKESFHITKQQTGFWSRIFSVVSDSGLCICLHEPSRLHRVLSTVATFRYKGPLAQIRITWQLAVIQGSQFYKEAVLLCLMGWPFC